jgi:hypothetical protein
LRSNGSCSSQTLHLRPMKRGMFITRSQSQTSRLGLGLLRKLASWSRKDICETAPQEYWIGLTHILRRMLFRRGEWVSKTLLKAVKRQRTYDDVGG